MVQQPHGTTCWNHSHNTGIRPSALDCLQQLQAGLSSSSSVQPLACTQGSNCTASSGSVSSPQSPHSDIRSQVPAGPTRNVTGNMMSATLAEVGTQLSFVEFLERCNLLIAPLPRPQPSPTLLLDAATQTSPHSVASADATTQLGSRSSLSGVSTPKVFWIARSHQRHMEMPAVPHFFHPLTSPASAVGFTRAAPLHATGATRSRGSSLLGLLTWDPC